MTFSKFIYISTLLFMLGGKGSAQCSDFVTVDGKKLKCGQNDFFAVVTNYVTEVMYECGASPSNIYNHFLSRNHQYSPDNMQGPEITNRAQGYAAILNDFTAIKNKGFNAVRVTGIRYGDVNTYDCTGSNQFIINYNSPDFDNWLLEMHADLIRAASQAGLKIILMLAEGDQVIPYNWYKVDANNNTTITFPPLGKTEGYINYLKLFSARFRNEPALLAIDFVNEPDHNTREAKSVFCALSKRWQDAVKSQSDILTTIGLASHSSWNWDFNLLHIDFASIHLYPPLKEKGTTTDMDSVLERVRSDFWWLKNNIRIPWMVGETGLQAHPNNTSHPINTTATWTQGNNDGTLQDQADYLQGTMDASRDYGACGYSWWEFSDNETGNPAYTDIADDYNSYWGIAYCNEGNTSTIWKPAANYISSFSPAPVSPGPGQPGLYYNYYGVPATSYFAFGTVKTTNNVPIRDAIVQVFSTDGKIYQTYTDNLGQFALHCRASMVQIKITATECNHFTDAAMNPNWASYNVQLTKLNRLGGNVLTYNNQVVAGISTNEHAETYAAFSNYQIFNSDFHITATNYIHLGAATFVEPGNRFSATIGNFYHNCSTIEDNANIPFRSSAPETGLEDNTASTPNLLVYPSPSSGHFTVRTGSHGTKRVQVVSSIGQPIFDDTFETETFELDLRLIPGVYFVSVLQNGARQQQKIIIMD